MFLTIILAIYLCISLFVGIVGFIFIIKECDIISGNIFKLIFMYQYAVYEWTKDDLNIVGIIILEILTTMFAWFFNVIIFFMVCTSYIFDAIYDLFYFLFAKR